MAMRRLPLPILVALAVVLPLGPVRLLTHHDAAARPNGPNTLAAVAARAGCRLTEFRGDMDTNPPVEGEFVERIRTRDGSYAGRRPPRLEATIHALYHGRVLIQYRPGLAGTQQKALETLVTDRVLLFENQTGMTTPVAATAYLSLMTCPRVDRRTLHALSVFRERRRAFGQAF
jgi:uncharacterized protein DUF3105